MSNEFSTAYIRLLRKQVEAEIKFLVANGHDNPEIHMPCMFCYDTCKAYYKCPRLGQLQEFQSSLLSNAIQDLRVHQRKRIGIESSIENFSNDNQTVLYGIKHSKLPLLSVRL